MANLSEKHMREYETLFVLRPEIEDEAAISFIENMKSLVEKEGGKHLQVTNWGRKKLAWERLRQQKGMYVHHRYLGGPSLVREYERKLGIEEVCLLRQTVVLDKAVYPESREPQEDVLQPPVTRSDRRDEMRAAREEEGRRYRDMDDDDDDDDEE